MTSNTPCCDCYTISEFVKCIYAYPRSVLNIIQMLSYIPEIYLVNNCDFLRELYTRIQSIVCHSFYIKKKNYVMLNCGFLYSNFRVCEPLLVLHSILTCKGDLIHDERKTNLHAVHGSISRRNISQCIAYMFYTGPREELNMQWLQSCT